MKPAIVLDSPQAITLHDKHPAAGLHPDVANRLIRLDADAELSAQELVEMSMLTPLVVVNIANQWRLVAGWHLWMLLRTSCVTDAVTCISYPKLSDAQIERMGMLDLLTTSRIAACDEIAMRLRATMDYRAQSNRSHVSRRQLHRIKNKYALPTHKQGVLDRMLQQEREAVWSVIAETPAPLGLRQKR